MADIEALANDTEDALYTIGCLHTNQAQDMTVDVADDRTMILLKLLIWAMSYFKVYTKQPTIDNNPAYDYLHDAVLQLESECVLHKVYSDDISINMIRLTNLITEFQSDIQSKEHEDQMKRFRLHGLHGMHGIATRRSPRLQHKNVTDHMDCVVCLDSDSKRERNVSDDCQHAPVLCITCVTQLDKCPVCNVVAASGSTIAVERS